MKTSDATNLDRLHDIVEPAPVSWWPLASGWYMLLGGLALLLVWAAWKWWRHWCANAYRREALKELQTATSVADISTLLRRTALVTTPREHLAGLTGSNWADWLSQQLPSATDPSMPRSVRDQLTSSVYQPSADDDPNANSVEELRSYAKKWIAHHQLQRPETESPAAGNLNRKAM
ncbi:DUF4381 domain-containing protein [Rhodopirellula sp. JC740]|uniref:DUF4381 domain-containing protein n=1 Tax=Rhodopirellula halodulae TaxID=2894198 RepID=A0ABS8NJ90_9BACT|nr:DUF4381 domain-containing protein [Rhodopirellula sp. JC740]MCC9643632.1 DUF4381 domain-containing protein [Rhodopirellula sp. JC740]